MISNGGDHNFSEPYQKEVKKLISLPMKKKKREYSECFLNITYLVLVYVLPVKGVKAEANEIDRGDRLATIRYRLIVHKKMLSNFVFKCEFLIFGSWWFFFFFEADEWEWGAVCAWFSGFSSASRRRVEFRIFDCCALCLLLIRSSLWTEHSLGRTRSHRKKVLCNTLDFFVALRHFLPSSASRIASSIVCCRVMFYDSISKKSFFFFWKMKLKTFSISSSSHSHCCPFEPVLCVSFASKRAARNRAFVSFVIWS